jgi:toxin YoeB
VRDKINSLIEDIQRHPFSGLGKPEPLKRNLKGFWSRRINREHRLVYRVDAGALQIAQCRFHY